MNHSENIQIECAENCGNSPKKQLLKEITIAFAKDQLDFCLEWMTDDVVWEIVGENSIQGKNNFHEQWNQLQNRDVQQLSIHNIITHGNTGSVNGTITRTDEQIIHFCDIYNFSGFGKNAKIKRITSYIIQKC